MDIKTDSLFHQKDYKFQPPDIFKYNTFNIINCPSHNPLNISSWLNNDNAFAVKWKWILPYLKTNNITSGYFKHLLRYIHIGKYIDYQFHFKYIPIDLFRDNDLFDDPEKYLNYKNCEVQKYKRKDDKIYFI